MRLRFFVITVISAVAALLFIPLEAPAAGTGDTSVSYPEGYRTWTFLHSSLVPPGGDAFSKSPCVKPCTNGIFHFYANELAMKGLRTGTYEDGAIIAEEMLQFRMNDKGYGVEGSRVLTAVMVKDSHRYAATGGWGYGHFDEGSTVNDLDAKAQHACYQCHTVRKDHDYVFSQYAAR